MDPVIWGARGGPFNSIELQLLNSTNIRPEIKKEKKYRISIRGQGSERQQKTNTLQSEVEPGAKF